MSITPLRILAIITARGGSKRLMGKNIRPLAGKPLLTWTIDAAHACNVLLHSVVLSTDDEAIAAHGRACGVQVPFMRPVELASDTAGSLEVVQHATRFIEQRNGVAMDWILLLQPTSPLRTAQDIDAAIALVHQNDCDSVVSVTPMPVHPVFAKRVDAAGLVQPFGDAVAETMRRQDATPPAYIHNGAIYLTRRDTLMQANSFYGARSRAYLMPPERSVDIDTALDFNLAELLLADLNSKR